MREREREGMKEREEVRERGVRECKRGKREGGRSKSEGDDKKRVDSGKNVERKERRQCRTELYHSYIKYTSKIIANKENQ